LLHVHVKLTVNLFLSLLVLISSLYFHFIVYLSSVTSTYRHIHNKHKIIIWQSNQIRNNLTIKKWITVRIRVSVGRHRSTRKMKYPTSGRVNGSHVILRVHDHQVKTGHGTSSTGSIHSTNRVVRPSVTSHTITTSTSHTHAILGWKSKKSHTRYLRRRSVAVNDRMVSNNR